MKLFIIELLITLNTQESRLSNVIKLQVNKVARLTPSSCVRRNVYGGGFIQWHMLVICIWCALFVTSQVDVISMFPTQRFGEVRRYNMHILSSAPTLFYMSSH